MNTLDDAAPADVGPIRNGRFGRVLGRTALSWSWNAATTGRPLHTIRSVETIAQGGQFLSDPGRQIHPAAAAHDGYGATTGTERQS